MPRIVSIGACLLMMSALAGAGTFTLYSTGFGPNGFELPPLSHDGNWSIVSEPGGSSTPFITVGYLLNTGPFKNNGWIGNSSSSEWISPAPLELLSDPPGTYVYEQTFDLDSFFNTAIITGQWAMDDTGFIDVNGQEVTTGLDGLVPIGATDGPGSFTPFVLDSSNANFVEGLNTIDFVVQNARSVRPNTTGMDVDIESTFIVPEPGSFALMGLGLSVLCLGAKKWKRS